MNVSEPINDEKCLTKQKWTEKSHGVFKASKHRSDFKEENKAFTIYILCCCAFRLIGSHTRGILVLFVHIGTFHTENDLIVSYFFHVII